MSAGRPAAAAQLVWHELECGGYRADLPLWRELALKAGDARGPTRLLDVGAGSGRVSLDLASAGHSVTALDRDPALLEALAARASGTVETVCADARDFALERRDFALCIVPMQTLQLLGGPDGREAFLRRARAHMRPGAMLAAAIVVDFDEFDCATGDAGPPADAVRRDGLLYVSRPSRVALLADRAVIERERRILTGRDRVLSLERDVVELDRVSSSTVEAEAVAVGLRPAARLATAATDEHVPSVVVVLGA